jgi:hypothetical protein
VGCNCGKAKASAYVVKLPGQPEQTVKSKDTADALVRGIRGASIRAVK